MPLHSAVLATALPKGCCKKGSRAPSDPKTTIAAAHTTAATLPLDSPARSAPGSPPPRLATPPPLLPPTLSRSAARTDCAAGSLLQTPLSCARSPASPAASVRPTRKSCRLSPPALSSTLPPRSRTTALQSDSAPPRRHSLLPTPGRPPATRAGPLYRSPSAATPPTARRLPEPCTPAASPADNAAALPPSAPLLPPRSPHTPPAAGRHLHPPAPPLLLPRFLPLPATPLRSRPTQSDSPAPSLAHLLALSTRSVRQPTAARCLPSGTISLPLSRCIRPG